MSFMLEKVFSVAYAPTRQARFLGDLNGGNYGSALSVLQGTLPGSTPVEKLDRVVMLQEGYRALAEEVTARFEDVCQRLGVKDLDDLDGRLDEIKQNDEDLQELGERLCAYDKNKRDLTTIAVELKIIVERLG